MRTLIATLAAWFFSQIATAPKTISLPTEDGGVVFADVYGTGDRCIVLAHGGPFNKESWAKQAQTLAAAGFQVLALDFWGCGKSRGPGQSDPMNAPLHLDVLAAVRYVRRNGAKSVSVVGGSMGGGPRATHQSLRSQVRLIAWYYSAQLRMAQPTSSNRPLCTLWHATTPTRMDRVFLRFGNSTRNLPS